MATVQGVNAAFSFANFICKYNRWSLGLNKNLFEHTGFSQQGTGTYDSTIHTVPISASGVILDAAGATVQGSLGLCTLAGTSVKWNAFDLTLAFTIINTTGFSSGIWSDFEITGVRLGFNASGVADSAAPYVPASYWTAAAATILNGVFQFSTNCTFNVPTAKIGNIPHDRAHEGAFNIGVSGVADDNWSMIWANNAPIHKTGVVVATGFAPALFKTAFVCTTTTADTYSGTAVPTVITLSRSVAPGTGAIVNYQGLATGAVLKS